MILEPLVNNSFKLESDEKVFEKKAADLKVHLPKNNLKAERIFTSRKEFGDSSKEKKSVKLNLYFGVLIVFLIGIVAGSIVFRSFIADDSVKEMIMEKFIAIESVCGTETEIFKASFTRNIKLLAIFWIVGISVVGAPLLILLCFYKGFTTAFAIASIILKFGFVQGNIYVFQKLFIYYLFLIFTLILLTASSIKVMINVLKYKKDIRLELVRHSIFTIIGLIFLVISSVIETIFL